jgi:ubiquinone/menaquinone biosynthesis C-methylase UbiE
MPLKQTVTRAFNDLAPRYEGVVNSEMQRFWGWTYASFVARLLECAGIRDGDTVLDIATGTSVIPVALLKMGHNPRQVIGLDIAFAVLKAGQHKLGRLDLPRKELIRPLCASAMSIPLRDACVDAVLCSLATHHMDVAVLIAEMARVLRPDGRMTVADVTGATSWWKSKLAISIFRALAFLYFLPRGGFSRAAAEADAVLNVYSVEQWRAALEQRGFADIDVVRLPARYAWFPNPWIITARLRPRS